MQKLCLSSGGSSNSKTGGGANTIGRKAQTYYSVKIFQNCMKTKEKLGREESTLNPPMVEGNKKRVWGLGTKIYSNISWCTNMWEKDRFRALWVYSKWSPSIGLGQATAAETSGETLWPKLVLHLKGAQFISIIFLILGPTQAILQFDRSIKCNPVWLY